MKFTNTGQTIYHERQAYTVLRFRPHTTMDGRQTEIVELVACCTQCGAPFVTTWPNGAHRPFQVARRCSKHRRPGQSPGKRHYNSRVGILAAAPELLIGFL
jgi:hypothetical protein